jgi:hypothetical protein
MNLLVLAQAALGLLILLGLLLAVELGFRLGRRTLARRGEREAGQFATVQGASLGLLALLLGFSFAGAASRFIERQDLIAEEANAIGTAWLRAELLGEPHRSELQGRIERYLAHRVEVSRGLRLSISATTLAEIDAHLRGIWEAARAGVTASPALTLTVVAPINEVIDLHAKRVAAGQKHLPTLVMVLLVLCSVLSMATIGFGTGLGGWRCFPMTFSLAVLISAALWTTVDLDHSRVGLIRLDDSALESLDLGRKG